MDRKEYAHKWYINRRDPNCGMDNNKDCALYLGVYIAERLLSKIFNDVTIMPFGQRGYDFICNKGKKIDVKASCRHKDEKGNCRWQFSTRKNGITDYFLFIGFDSRNTINPEYVWFVPRSVINYRQSITISESQLLKWNDYKIDKIDEVIECCNTLR